MAYEKLLNEIYAAVSLKYLWKEYEPYFVKSESPDWINPNMDFRLEVSQALCRMTGRRRVLSKNILVAGKRNCLLWRLKNMGNAEFLQRKVLGDSAR